MRAAVTKMGYKVPYNSCDTYNNYYKDINHCNFFIFFDCSDLHPTPAAVSGGEQEPAAGVESEG